MNHPTLKGQVTKFAWSKAPSEASLQLFRSLPFHTDNGTLSPFLSGGAANDEEGAVEYECWVRPCDKYPKGLVFRVLGDSNPVVLHLEDEEAIPGELPYKDAEGNAVFTFEAAPFEQRGGRVYGSSPLDAGIALTQHQPQAFMLSPHDVTLNLLSKLGVKLEVCHFREVKGNQQYVELIFSGSRKVKTMKVRADHAISFCMQAGVKFYCTRQYLEKCRQVNAEISRPPPGARRSDFKRNRQHYMN